VTGNIKYQKEMYRTFLIAESGKRELIDSYAGKIVMQKGIDGILNCSFRLIDGENEIWYDISSMHSIKQVFAVKPIEYDELERLVHQLFFTLDELEKYLMGAEQLCMEPEYIFVNMEKKKFFFLYDYTEKREERSILSLAEFLIEKVNPQDEKALEIAYSFFEYVANGEYENLERKLFQEKKEKREELPKAQETIALSENPIIQDALVLSSGLTIQKSKIEEKSKLEEKNKLQWKLGIGSLFLAALLTIIFFVVRLFYVLSPVEIIGSVSAVLLLLAIGLSLSILSFFKEKYSIEKQKEKKDLPEEELLYKEPICNQEETEEDGKTVYVGNISVSRSYSLIERSKNTEIIHTLSFPYFIGKDKERVHLVLKDKSVSRIHAKLTEEEGAVYIEDLHSTNGTSLNDMPLQPHVRTRIKRGDYLQLGKTELELR